MEFGRIGVENDPTCLIIAVECVCSQCEFAAQVAVKVTGAQRFFDGDIAAVRSLQRIAAALVDEG